MRVFIQELAIHIEPFCDSLKVNRWLEGALVIFAEAWQVSIQFRDKTFSHCCVSKFYQFCLWFKLAQISRILLNGNFKAVFFYFRHVRVDLRHSSTTEDVQLWCLHHCHLEIVQQPSEGDVILMAIAECLWFGGPLSCQHVINEILFFEWTSFWAFFYFQKFIFLVNFA